MEEVQDIDDRAGSSFPVGMLGLSTSPQHSTSMLGDSTVSVNISHVAQGLGGASSEQPLVARDGGATSCAQVEDASDWQGISSREDSEQAERKQHRVSDILYVVNHGD